MNDYLNEMMLNLWPAEWQDLDAARKAIVLADYLDANREDGCTGSEYRRRIGSCICDYAAVLAAGRK